MADTDLLEELGALALGSRLKRLSDTLMQDGVRIYQKLGVGFEPRWFPVFIYLYRKGPTAITELARGLGVSHPGINKIGNELISAKLVAAYRDRKDKRKRVLALTREGREKFAALEPVWRDIRRSLQSAIEDSGGSFLGSLSALEQSFRDQSFCHRFEGQQKKAIAGIEIRAFEPGDEVAFREINEHWIRDYFSNLEAEDRKVLDDPAGTIIANGGEVLFARSEGVTLGTCALIRHSDAVGELAKMGVTDAARGKQVGLSLGVHCIEMSRAKGWQKLFLESNRMLVPAITLYKKLGFEERPFPHPSDYARADIYMELDLLASD